MSDKSATEAPSVDNDAASESARSLLIADAVFDLADAIIGNMPPGTQQQIVGVKVKLSQIRNGLLRNVSPIEQARIALWRLEKEDTDLLRRREIINRELAENARKRRSFDHEQ